METLTDRFVGELLAGQRAFFGKGTTLPYAYRAEQLKKLKKAIISYEGELEKALAADLGKSRQESYLTEIGFVLAGITHTLRHLKKWMRPVRVRSGLTVFPSVSKVIAQPYGSVLIMGPYNYPFQLLIEPLTAAISAGNCAVLSPSEQTPNVSRVVRRMLGETFEKDYVFCSEGGVGNNETLLRGSFDKIFFTGSENVGKIVMRAAAENLIPVTLELGGKSPVIVDKSARLKIACERIVWGKFMNAGQTCVAPDYIFAHRSIYPQLIEGLTEAIRRFYGDEPLNSPDYGRIVNERHMKRLMSVLERDREFIVYGGKVDLSARYIAPTVLCPKNARQAACMREELFGPLLPVFPYDDIEAVLSYINGHEKPLALYIFSEDACTVNKILAGTSSGGVSINDTISHIINPNLPFGGIGRSGMGRYHGKYGFSEFSHERSVLKRSSRICIRLSYPPFTDEKLRKIKKIMK